jgi:hypothetical protein
MHTITERVVASTGDRDEPTVPGERLEHRRHFPGVTVPDLGHRLEDDGHDPEPRRRGRRASVASFSSLAGSGSDDQLDTRRSQTSLAMSDASVA